MTFDGCGKLQQEVEGHFSLYWSVVFPPRFPAVRQGFSLPGKGDAAKIQDQGVSPEAKSAGPRRGPAGKQATEAPPGCGREAGTEARRGLQGSRAQEPGRLKGEYPKGPVKRSADKKLRQKCLPPSIAVCKTTGDWKSNPPLFGFLCPLEGGKRFRLLQYLCQLPTQSASMHQPSGPG